MMSNGTATFWIIIAAVSASFGALHGYLFNDGPTLPGIIYGTCVGVLVIAYKRGVLLAGYSKWLRP
jgi:adenylate cyclase